MRVHCQLRALRGTRSLRDLERETGIHRGALSRYETGKEFPRDKHLHALEQAYGAPRETWWNAHILAELQADGTERLPTALQAAFLAKIASPGTRALSIEPRRAEPLIAHGWVTGERTGRYYHHVAITPAGLHALANHLETQEAA